MDYTPSTAVNSCSLVEYLRHEFARTIGVELTVRRHIAQAAWKQQIASWDFQVTTDLVYNWGDPLIGVHRTYDSHNIRRGVMWSNTQHYRNPEVDRLMTLAGSEMDPKKRKAVYMAFQQQVMEDLPLYPLVLLPYRTIYNPRLGGIDDNIWGVLSPLDEVFWKKEQGSVE